MLTFFLCDPAGAMYDKAPNAGACVIEVKNLSKSFGSGHSLVQVLSAIRFQIKPGTFSIFLGRSGSGKSTLLNLLAGLERPDKGTIEILGHDLSRRSPEQLADFRLKHLGLVFQFFNLLPTLTLRENVELAGRLKELPAREIRARADAALEQVRLSGESGRMPHEASGGEIQRAAIARALVHDPDIILADEPTGNLDAHNREAVAAIFSDLVRIRKKTLLMVTHDASFNALGDRVFRLENGRLSE